MEKLECTVEIITYQNSENGYSVLRCAVENHPDIVTAVGTMPGTHVGAVLSLEGFWKNNPKYGLQFSVEKYEEVLPATVAGIENYLGSGLIKGIGPSNASNIVKHFGEDTLRVLDEEPDRLLEVRRIGKAKLEKIKSSWAEQKEIRNIMIFLQNYDISTAHATKIYKTYGADSIAIVKENPYRLADDIWGIGFRTADQIAQKIGIQKDKFIRLRSGILFTLNKLSNDGHCYALREQLVENAVKLLEVEAFKISATLDEMIHTSDVVQEDEAIYLQLFYFAEVGCAKKLINLVKAKGQNSIGENMQLDVDDVMQRVEQQGDITYDEI